MKKEEYSLFSIIMTGNTEITVNIKDYQSITYLFLLSDTPVYSQLMPLEFSNVYNIQLFKIVFSISLVVNEIIHLPSGSMEVFDNQLLIPILTVIPVFFAFVSTCINLMKKLHQSFIWCGIGGHSNA